MRTEGDVLLQNTPDGGEITVERGTVAMAGGLETTVYLSLFGGNARDPGDGESQFEWWGNLAETDPARRYRSHTQHLLDGLPATPGNLLRVEDAVLRDMQPLIDAGVISGAEAAASIIGPKRVRIRVRINGDTILEFRANWEQDSGY